MREWWAYTVVKVFFVLFLKSIQIMKNKINQIPLFLITAFLFACSGGSSPDSGDGGNKDYDPVDVVNLTSESSKYIILETRTDNFDKAKAKSNAEDAITKFKDLQCMVGLFAYNSPSCIDAIKEADKLNQIKVCGFDEQDALLEAIGQGHAYGTVSQQPWEYGYQSIKKLKELYEAQGNEVSPSTSFAYVTNGVDPFWDLCAAGVRIAEKEFGISCEVLMPPKGVVDQKRMMETLLANSVDGIAVSPVDAENQTPFLNEVAENTILITNDSDAPDSKRLAFIGTNNYKAGRALGKLVKKAVPEGGEVVLFVGRLEQLNARQRRQGVIDELLERPVKNLGSETKGYSETSFLLVTKDNVDEFWAKKKEMAELGKTQ